MVLVSLKGGWKVWETKCERKWNGENATNLLFLSPCMVGSFILANRGYFSDNACICSLIPIFSFIAKMIASFHRMCGISSNFYRKYLLRYLFIPNQWQMSTGTGMHAEER